MSEKMTKFHEALLPVLHRVLTDLRQHAIDSGVEVTSMNLHVFGVEDDDEEREHPAFGGYTATSVHRRGDPAEVPTPVSNRSELVTELGGEWATYAENFLLDLNLGVAERDAEVFSAHLGVRPDYTEAVRFKDGKVLVSFVVDDYKTLLFAMRYASAMVGEEEGTLLGSVLDRLPKHARPALMTHRPEARPEGEPEE